MWERIKTTKLKSISKTQTYTPREEYPQEYIISPGRLWHAAMAYELSVMIFEAGGMRGIEDQYLEILGRGE